MKKSCRIYPPNGSSRPLFSFGKLPKNSHCMQEKEKENYQKFLKKLTLVFLSNPVPFNGQDCDKRKLPRTSDQSLFRFQNKFKKISLLTDQV